MRRKKQIGQHEINCVGDYLHQRGCWLANKVRLGRATADTEMEAKNPRKFTSERVAGSYHEEIRVAVEAMMSRPSLDGHANAKHPTPSSAGLRPFQRRHTRQQSSLLPPAAQKCLPSVHEGIVDNRMLRSKLAKGWLPKRQATA
ncbi:MULTISPECIES: hypothetical protein [unclassified Variovorax]|uniref:hypothetical protein n=1 Tax=unclassified Variovorax TaxID=663243 RepID=UPI001BD4EC7F|nr:MULTISPECIES: hypothetical protein [unclassified Variovorax]